MLPISLHRAIESLYCEFSTVPHPSTIPACPCCLSADEIEVLLSTPLRAIPGNDLSSYAASAFLTVAEKDDYLYFLPRILELSITGENFSWPSLEVTGRAVKDAGFQQWSSSMQRTLSDFLLLVVEHIVRSGEHWKIDEWMCGIGLMELDVEPFLGLIEQNQDAVLEYWKDNSGKLDRGLLGNEFWDPPNAQHDQIVKWFQSSKINLIYAAAYGYRMQ
ncbi:MAG: hypothetical protein ACKVRN_06005 [Pyrinomonadaceae bacterium]